MTGRQSTSISYGGTHSSAATLWEKWGLKYDVPGQERPVVDTGVSNRARKNQINRYGNHLQPDFYSSTALRMESFSFI